MTVPVLYSLTILKKGGHRDDSLQNIRIHDDDVLHDDAREGIVSFISTTTTFSGNQSILTKNKWREYTL